MHVSADLDFRSAKTSDWTDRKISHSFEPIYTMERQGRNIERNFISEILTYLFTYLLTPRNRVLLEKVTGSQLVMKLPAVY